MTILRFFVESIVVCFWIVSIFVYFCSGRVYRSVFAFTNCSRQNNTASVWTEIITTGRQSQQIVIRLNIYVNIPHGTSAYFIDKSVEFFFIIEINLLPVFEYCTVVLFRFGVDNHDTENLIFLFFVNTIEANNRMLFIEVQLFVVGQWVEHQTVITNVMTVDDQIIAAAFRIGVQSAFIVQIRDTVVIILTLEIASMIVQIVFRLHNRIGQVGTFDFDPALHIIIDRNKRLIFIEYFFFYSSKFFFIDLITVQLAVFEVFLHVAQFFVGFHRIDTLQMVIHQVANGTAEHTEAKNNAQFAHFLAGAVSFLREESGRKAFEQGRGSFCFVFH